MDYTKLRNAYPDESQPSIGWLKIAHGLGFLCQLGLVIAISVALDEATDKLLAQSTVLSVIDKPRFPERIGTTSIFGEGRRLKAGKLFSALVGSLVARGANCEQTSCCHGNGFNTVQEMSEEVLISDCWIETDHRWADPFRAHVSEPGYRILWLVLMAPLISSLHHLFALYILFGKNEAPGIWIKYLDYSLSASFILIALYMLVKVYSFELQILGFFCSALSIGVFGYVYEMTGRNTAFWVGCVCHIMAWVPFFVNLGQLLAHRSQLEVQIEPETAEVAEDNGGKSANMTGIGMAIGGSIIIFAAYPIATFNFRESKNLQLYHTVLSVFAKTALAVGVLIAVRFF